MTTWRIPVDIDIQPWFADHRFDGKVVLPAVETMSLLAADVAGNHPEMDIQVMEQVCFSRFLEIPEGSSRVAALIEYQKNENGSLSAKLLSRRQYQAVTRMQEHGEVLFSPAPASRKHIAPFVAMKPLPDAHREIPAEQVYRELVPFGPGYHTLQGTLYLDGRSAWGSLRAPLLPASGRTQDRTGSPFPLDGAFHAACVLGQQTVDFVPFPVGFERRIILKPTEPGGSYRTQVELLSRTRDELLFDLHIYDDQGLVYERVSGLRMRDVSGGAIKPPEWMKALEEKSGGICDRPTL
jgi:hypothetical protein